MKELFLDLPEAIESIEEIIGKCEHYGKDAKIDVFFKSLRRKSQKGHF